MLVGLRNPDPVLTQLVRPPDAFGRHLKIVFAEASTKYANCCLTLIFAVFLIEPKVAVIVTVPPSVPATPVANPVLALIDTFSGLEEDQITERVKFFLAPVVEIALNC